MNLAPVFSLPLFRLGPDSDEEYFTLPIFARSHPRITGRPQPSGQITMTIVGPGAQLSSIAVSGLKSLGGDDDHRLGSAFVDVARDLELRDTSGCSIRTPTSKIRKSRASSWDSSISPIGDRSTPTFWSRERRLPAAAA